MLPGGSGGGSRGPTGFVGGGFGPVPQGQPARVVEVVAPARKATHQAVALVHVRIPDRVELNREALRQANLGPGKVADIVPPRRGVANEWLLNTNPTTARCRLLESSGSGGVFFRTRQTLPAAPFQPPPGEPARKRSRLRFMIGPELMEEVCVPVPGRKPVCRERGTGVYRLLPV
ncbi:hypothetical protein [Hymenobacter psychrophilus]|uniref:Uncharacterized protein n=1 Tax=Hymenobacter psychrophilus TaxID=651662 RepID=A0A1H3PAC6_9BACT|nr:hypothetical protein [Hymenobacter psychrophilus]SDY98076.1 hypothetical protein SAMN04488069_12611 [Hymenobacter psychrophilus]